MLSYPYRLGKSYQVACLPEPFGYRESVDAQNNTNEGLSFSATHYIPTNSASEPKKKMHWKKKKALAANGLAIQDTILERGTAAELVYSPSEVPPEKCIVFCAKDKESLLK